MVSSDFSFAGTPHQQVMKVLGSQFKQTKSSGAHVRSRSASTGDNNSITDRNTIVFVVITDELSILLYSLCEMEIIEDINAFK